MRMLRYPAACSKDSVMPLLDELEEGLLRFGEITSCTGVASSVLETASESIGFLNHENMPNHFVILFRCSGDLKGTKKERAGNTGSFYCLLRNDYFLP